ncbi:MAG: ADOP family duplicated permease [Candidatus Solibacter sp.]|nr:ADOP family duplicated permease [Candidatus Solibacter sp.]
MTARLRRWLEETHSDTFELVRHFLARFFDTEIGASSGDWHKVAIGVFACLVSLGIIGFQTYLARFRIIQDAANSTPQLYQAAVRGDLISLVALVMAMTALLTLLQWQSLFPSLRDYMALAGFPVSARQIFVAKFAALVLLFAAFVLSLTGPLAGFFGVAIRGHWQENPSGQILGVATFAALAGSGFSVFFSLLAVQGLLLNFVPSRWFQRVSLFVQASLFIATVGALPLMGRQPASAAWWPPFWFIRLWESIVVGRASARPAFLAVVLPPAIAILAYLLSYHRYRKLLLEAPPARAGGHWSGLGSRVLELWIRDPREQAAFAFTWKTLSRSRIHRLLLLAFAGLALGWVVEAALSAQPVSLRDEGMYGLMAVASPLGLAVLMILALRYLFSLPVTLQANWMFQTCDQEGRGAWLAAVERFVMTCGIAPVYLASLPASIAILGWVRGLGVSALGALVALLCFERLFRHWCKLPFTCSYIPGKQAVWMLLFRYSMGMIYFAAIPPMLLAASGELAAFLALFTGLALFWRRWRRVRQAQWAEAAMLWEEAPEADLQALHLRPLEQDASVTTTAQRAPEMFSAGMVASRGLLPQAWEEEIAEDRRDLPVLLATFWEDVRYGCRVIRRNPLLSLVVILTLTVGIGINASVFTVVNGMMLKPHVYKDPASFLRIVPQSRLQSVPRQVSYQEYMRLRDSTRTLRQLAAFSYFPVVIGDDDPGGSVGIAVSCNFFLVDGLDRAIVGRLIDQSDCGAPGQAPVAVIGEKVWHQRFASDPRIVGRVARVNNRPVTIVGVAPGLTTSWLTPPNIWLPYTAQPYLDSSRSGFTDDTLLWLTLAGRLAPGYSRAHVRAEFDMLERQEDRLHHGRATAVTTTDGSWLAEFELYMGARELFLLAFFVGSFTMVLLIACANVATLLLSRSASRRREIAVRLALGAPRVRLVRMLITESLILAAIAGGASAYLVRHVPHPLFRYLAPRAPDYPMDPDWRIFLYISAIVLFSGILSGLAPALESVKVDLTSSLKGYTSMLSGGRLRAALVSAQVALSMVLLVSAGLFAKSEERNLHADPGYLPQKVVVSPLRFPENTSAATARVRLDAIAQRLKALPGAHSVAFSDELPMISRTTVELRPPARADAVQAVDIYTGSPGFFETLGVPILRGREFQESDGSAIVVSRNLARTFWPKEDPLGKALTLRGVTATVVGVAKDVDPVRFFGSENPPLYLMRRAHPNRNVVAVRFDGDATAGAFAVRAALREFDPGMFVVARVLQGWIEQVTEVLWNMVSLIVFLGLVATVLATTGIYGAVSFAVNQRTRDLGIRLALGASRFDIVREVFVSGGQPVVRGLFIGLWLSVAQAASLRQNMKGTPLRLDSGDPLLYGGAALLLAAAAALAMAGPARRGSKADPLDALRCD